MNIEREYERKGENMEIKERKEGNRRSEEEESIV
jgi:hypothetical protein